MRGYVGGKGHEVKGRAPNYDVTRSTKGRETRYSTLLGTPYHRAAQGKKVIRWLVETSCAKYRQQGTHHVDLGCTYGYASS